MNAVVSSNINKVGPVTCYQIHMLATRAIRAWSKYRYLRANTTGLRMPGTYGPTYVTRYRPILNTLLVQLEVLKTVCR